MIRAAILLAAALAACAAEGVEPSPARIQRVIPGWTQPLAGLDLAPEVAGRLVELRVQPGERIAGDAPVARLDPELADLAVTAASVARDEGGAQIAVARAGEAAAAGSLAARRAERERRLSEREQAGRDRERIDGLHAKGLASEQQREATALALRQSELAASAAEADLAAAEAAAAQAAAARSAAEARLAGLEAALATARAQRARHELRAPAGWVVRERLAEPGAVLAAGQPVLRLADTSALVVALRLDEDELASVRARAAAGSLTVRFAGGREAAAALRRVDVAYDAGSRKRLVELLVAGAAAPEASGGLNLELVVEVDDPSGGLAVPEELVVWRVEQAWVRLAGGDERPVRVLRRAAGSVVLAAGSLPAGARLVPPTR